MEYTNDSIEMRKLRDEVDQINFKVKEKMNTYNKQKEECDRLQKMYDEEQKNAILYILQIEKSKLSGLKNKINELNDELKDAKNNYEKFIETHFDTLMIYDQLDIYLNKHSYKYDVDFIQCGNEQNEELNEDKDDSYYDDDYDNDDYDDTYEDSYYDDYDEPEYPQITVYDSENNKLFVAIWYNDGEGDCKDHFITNGAITNNEGKLLTVREIIDLLEGRN